MVGVNEFGIFDASRAEIPVWTVEAFVTNSIDKLCRVSLKVSVSCWTSYLLATIADSSVADVPAFTAKEVRKSSESCV